MPIYILSIILQVAFVIHIVKTGRSTTWIWIVIVLPLAGAIAYFVLEVLPELSNSRTGRAASRKISNTINPNRDINRAANRLSISDTVENNMRLADECLNKALYQEAKTLYEKCLTGIHANEPHLLVGLAKSEFMLGNYSKTQSILDQLIASNPDYKNQDAHLLYARTLESLNQISGALHEYEVLHGYFSGPEASLYYALFLKSQGQADTACSVLESILDIAKKSSKHYSSLHKDILRRVKTELKLLEKK